MLITVLCFSDSPSKKSRCKRKKNDPLSGLKRKDEDEDWDEEYDEIKPKNRGKKKGASREFVNSRDDGDLDNYEARLRQHQRDEQQRASERREEGEEESGSGSDLEIDGGFKVPGRLWGKLYR